MTSKRTSRQPLIAVLVVVLAFISTACESLPEANLRQTEIGMERTFEGSELVVSFSNPAAAPLRLRMRSVEPDVDAVVNSAFILGASADSTLRFDVSGIDTTLVTGSLRVSFTFGDPSRSLNPNPLRWPFPADRDAGIMQAYNGSFSHQTDFSRYALDFELAVGDTISAADDGMVIGVIDGYAVGGGNRNYRDFANYITLFHPHSGLTTQYVHLEPEGSFVAVGDTVRRGQPIGTVGLTGFTTAPHLHFNVLVPDSSGGMISFPVTFEDGTDGASLSRRDVVSHPAPDTTALSSSETE